MGEFTDEFARICEALAPIRNVVLLLPCPDKRASLAHLRERHAGRPEGWTILEHLVTHPSNETLARHVVYVEGRSPAEVADDVLRGVTPVDGPGGP